MALGFALLSPPPPPLSLSLDFSEDKMLFHTQLPMRSTRDVLRRTHTPKILPAL